MFLQCSRVSLWKVSNVLMFGKSEGMDGGTSWDRKRTLQSEQRGESKIYPLLFSETNIVKTRYRFIYK